jgi:glycerate dehydrogenase
MNISVLDWDTMTMNGDISPDCLNELGNVRIFGMTEPCDTVKNIGNADVVLCNKVQITEEIMKQCPSVRYIGLFATGYNNIDIPYAASRGITVCNAGQYSTMAVAQQVFAYILDRYSRINDYNNAVSNGEWERSGIFSYFPIATHELYGKTLSIVGFGSIGKAVARIGESFGMNIVVCTRTVPQNCRYEITDLQTAARKADILTFHCPLTDKTKNLVNRELLSVMKPSAMLINTSRGGVVNEKDLADALNGGMIDSAYLDVLATEPMSPDTPLKQARNCIITPHTAWAALETRKRLLDIVCDNLKAYKDGKPQNKVN